MSDLRFDPVTGCWVAIAQNRLDRPTEFIPIEQVRQQLICPFCVGNEENTPQHFHTFDEDGNVLAIIDSESDWKVRAIPNKYPSFHGHVAHPQQCGPYSWNNTVGHQEILIPTPRHVTSLSDLESKELVACFKACQFRIGELRNDASIKHAMLFMNCRARAGASLAHIHFQLIGSPIISRHLQDRIRRNQESVENFGRTILERIIEWEQEQKIRVVCETEHFLVICPFASRFAFQTWIVPRDSSLKFVDLADAVRNQLAETCRRMVATLESQLDNTAYNLLLHQAPFQLNQHDHWYFELFPRLTQGAGFELGTDIWVNPISPATAAKRLQH